MQGHQSRNLLAFLLLALCTLPVAAHGPADYADLYEKARKSVVEIHEVVELGDSSDTSLFSWPNGTGVIISSDGHILTNAHVIWNLEEERELDSIQVILHDKRGFTAEIIGYDLHSDVALLKIDIEEELPAVKIGDTDKMRIGDGVLAIGHPGDGPDSYDYSLTSGIISSLSRWLSGPIEVSVECSVPFIQTDTVINRGNSGGPLINLKGELVGINTMGGGSYPSHDYYTGMEFAVEINWAMDVLKALRGSGEIRWGMLGVFLKEASNIELSSSWGTGGDTRGVLVNGVKEGTGAEKAGIERGDVIVEYNGAPVNDLQDFRCLRAGTTIPVKLVRDGKPMTVHATLGAIEEEGLLAAIE